MLRLAVFLSVAVLASLLPGCEEVGPDADCFERTEDEEFGNPRISNTCEWEYPCDGLNLECPGHEEAVDCGPDEASVQNPEALTCILDALAEGKRGAFSWSTTAASNPGWARRRHELWTRGGKAYYASAHFVDLDVDIDGVRYVKLRSRGAFARCRDASSTPDRLRCLMDPWTEVLGVVIPRG